MTTTGTGRAPGSVEAGPTKQFFVSMITRDIGGIFHTDAQTAMLEEAFAGLAQVRGAADGALSLEAPVLTAREVRHLLAQLPSSSSATPGDTPDVISSPGVPDGDVAKFVSLYRYYPLYAEIGGQ